MPPLTIQLPDKAHALLLSLASAAGQQAEELAAAAVERYLALPDLARRSSFKGDRRPSQGDGASVMYISNPVVGLLEGLVRSNEVTVGAALAHGDFGLGTLNQLDGELVVLDSKPYQLKADGTVCDAIKLELGAAGPLAYDALLAALTAALPSPNLFYAIKVVGEYRTAKARSVKRVPTRRGEGEAGGLRQAAAQQTVFSFEDGGQATLIGFWAPTYVGHSLTVPGFHLHMLSADLTKGGHLLNMDLARGTAWIQPLYAMETELPHSESFAAANLEGNHGAELERLEKEK
eukprot:scaffold6.g2630.t1